MQVFDFHTHIFPDALAQRALGKLAYGAHIQPLTDGTLTGTAKYMQSEGVSRFLALNIATNAAQQTNVNDFACFVQKTGLAESFGSVFPKSEIALSELDRIRQAGLKGIKLHPEYQGFDLDDPSAFPVYEACRDAGLLVVIHAGIDAAFPSSLRAGVSAIQNVVKNFPGLKLIAAHFGGFLRANDVLESLAGTKGLYLDTSCSVGFIDPNIAGQIIQKHGAENVLFGSDCPWGSPAAHIRLIDGLNISAQDKELIFYQNAERLLNIKLD